MALGSLKFRGIGLGTAGVLFAWILVGHFGERVDHHILDFVKEFGLILFVFTIGLQLGPGFFAALRHQGGKMNVLAAASVISGAATAPLIGWLAGFDPAAVRKAPVSFFRPASSPKRGHGSRRSNQQHQSQPSHHPCPQITNAGFYAPPRRW
jgi:putative transport protein